MSDVLLYYLTANMMGKSYSFDFIRAVAIIMIVMCHYLQFSKLNISLGGHMGGVGNCVFFMLSSLLFGLKWERSRRQPFETDFFKKRFVKIASSLYPFLFFLIIAFILCDVKFRMTDVVLNFFFLGWVAKLPGNGHLWFLTVLMMCYVIFFSLSRFHGRILNRWWQWVMLGTLAATCLVLVESRGLPGHAFITLYLATLGFSHAGYILARVKKVPFQWMFLQFVFIAGTTHCLFLSFEVYNWCRPVAVLLNNLCGISLLLFLLKLEHKRKLPVMTFLSGISFELYLVHHGFCQGDFSVFQFTNNYFMMLVFLIIASLTCAYILKKVAYNLKK